MLEELGKSHTVKAFTYSRQYPSLLFPGKTQYVGPDDEAVKVDAEPVVDTVNPFSWRKAARKIRAWKPDVVILRYWMSWFAPALGVIARHCGCPKVIALIDNALPHERHFFDRPLAKWFFEACNGFITMSPSVSAELQDMVPDGRFDEIPHPLYTHFGSKIPKEEAEDRLGLSHGPRNLLFFGLIRDYKGLDVLLEAFRGLDERYRLIIAGEPYGSFDKYEAIIRTLPGKDRIVLHTDYIKDSDVKKFFSAADLVVLPYKSATQSGIAAISYHFDIPLVTTLTGSIGCAVQEAGTGIAVPPGDPAAVAGAIERYFNEEGVADSCRAAIAAEKERLSWKNFCNALVDFAESI
ncbi:MAG: glycosyltransferase [Bacteroidales bacterium]|nr:glycosyltransferase [Bacteroidales bacterium]